MPDLSVYEELSLVAMDIDSVPWGGSKLRATYGDGYGDSALTGNPNGVHRWTISSSVLTDDTSYGDLIEGVPTFEYYWNFFKRHTTGERDVFLIEFRGRKYFAEFVETEIAAEMFSIDLFGNVVLELRQRRVRGFYEGSEGHVFNPAYIESGIWGWYDEQSYLYFTSSVLNKMDSAVHPLTINSDIVSNGAVQNGRATHRFNGVGGGGFLHTLEDPLIYEAFFALKVREATFTGYQGILSADLVTVAMVGHIGDTKLTNLLFGGTYSYRKNGVLLTEATQNAPMNTFGVIHSRWTNGITLANLQIGKDRDYIDRYLKTDMAEIVLCDELLSDADSTDMDGFLMHGWGVS